MIGLQKHMAYTAKFLHPIRHSLTVLSSPRLSFSHLKRLNNGKFDSVKAFLKSLEPSLCRRASIFQSDLKLTREYLRNIHFCGISGSIVVVSIAYGSSIAHAMDAQDALVDIYCEDSLDPSEEEEHPHQLWMFARKFWLPAFLFLTVLTSLDGPMMVLLAKVTLFLLSTKPNPYSVYVFVDQLCQQSMHEESLLHKVKSLYASKVEVQDYKLLCLANVEVRGQNFTLVGILGDWWTLPHLLPQEAFTLLRNRIGRILVKTT